MPKPSTDSKALVALIREQTGSRVCLVPRYPQNALTRCGRLYSLKSTKNAEAPIEIKQNLGKSGYWQAYVVGRRSRNPVKLYVLMARTFLPPRPSDIHLVRHLDGNPLNHRLENLAWGTPQENADDRKKHNESRSKLTKQLKADIEERLREGPHIGLEAVVEEFNTSFLTVNRIYWKLRKENESM